MDYEPFKNALAKCRLVMSGGEGYPMALRDAIRKCSDNIRIINTYGPTEITVSCNAADLTEAENVTPANATEAFFCESFKNALKLERVGATDDFFEIGGTSLVVTSVVLDASENGFSITYGDVFKYTTPRALAELFRDGEVNDTNKLFDFDDYDYTAINELLAKNTVEAFHSEPLRDLGNVMITGATGYMGAHLLAEFLKKESGKAYCKIRKGKFDSAQERLENIMFYYFGTDLESEFAARVEVLNGDVTDYKYFEPFESLPVNTVNAVGVSVEELCHNIAVYANTGGNNAVDVCVRVLPDKVNVRLRDNGAEFDPTDYIDSSGKRITGLQLVRMLSSSVNYNRVLGFNVTNVAIDYA